MPLKQRYPTGHQSSKSFCDKPQLVEQVPSSTPPAVPPKQNSPAAHWLSSSHAVPVAAKNAPPNILLSIEAHNECRRTAPKSPEDDADAPASDDAAGKDAVDSSSVAHTGQSSLLYPFSHAPSGAPNCPARHAPSALSAPLRPSLSAPSPHSAMVQFSRQFDAARAASSAVETSCQFLLASVRSTLPLPSSHCSPSSTTPFPQEATELEEETADDEEAEQTGVDAPPGGVATTVSVGGYPVQAGEPPGTNANALLPSQVNCPPLNVYVT